VLAHGEAAAREIGDAGSDAAAEVLAVSEMDKEGGCGEFPKKSLSKETACRGTVTVPLLVVLTPASVFVKN